MKTTIIFIVSLLSLCAAADDKTWTPLEGTYSLTGSELIDPDPQQPQHTHLRFSLTGKVAQDLYQAMEVEVVMDECTGLPSKAVKDMRCYFDQSDNGYMCDFSIDLAKQKIGYGLSC